MDAHWVITGAGGQLGADLAAELDARSIAVTPLAKGDLDITDASEVSRLFRDVSSSSRMPLIVVNAAAYVAVDAAESDEETAYQVNAIGAESVATVCQEHGGRLIHISTDYVFDGQASQPYEPTATPSPKTAYGRTKLAGERLIALTCPYSYVVRTAWLYGDRGHNFVRTMARLERDRDEIHVVDDQTGSPTWSRDLARSLVELGNSTVPYGTYHCVNSGAATWYELARAVFEELGADPDRVRPVPTDQHSRPAPRPAYSVLSNSAWLSVGLPAMPHWRDALQAAFRQAGDRLRGDL